MQLKLTVKRCVWALLVIFLSFLMVWAARSALDNVWIEGELRLRHYVFLSWRVLKEIAAFLPLWFLAVLGLARSCLGENFFPFAEKIPIRVTKIVSIAAAALLIIVSAAGALFLKQTENLLHLHYAIDSRVETAQSLFAAIVFYGVLLYTEQWGIQQNRCRHSIRKIQAWLILSLLLLWVIWTSLGGVRLWYIPLSCVDSPNTLEDYYLWYSSLYSAVFVVPIWFFAARKTIRLIKENAKWMELAAIIPQKLTLSLAAAAAGLMIQQMLDCRYYSDLRALMDVPEYAEAAAMGHGFQTMMWGVVLLYALCLLLKQLLSARRTRKESIADSLKGG